MEYYETDEQLRHTHRPQSGLGIASFVIVCLSGLFEIAVLVAAAVAQTRTPGGITQNSTAALLIGLAVLFAPLINLVGVGLGIGGLFQRNRGKVFAILGV